MASLLSARRPSLSCFTLSPMGLPAGRAFDPAAMAAARQEALLAAASWLFNLKGVDATSLEEIAVRVGVTKKVIYHNIGDKQTLVAQCIRRAFRFYEDIGARDTRLRGLSHRCALRQRSRFGRGEPP